MTPLNKSPFSRHFLRLTFIGAWIVHERDPKRLLFYVGYKLIMTVIALSGAYLLLEDLILVFGDFKKVTWNLCISTLFTGSLIKNLYCIRKGLFIDKLRWKLHRNAESRKSPEYLPIHQSALKQLKYLELVFYGVGTISVTFWLVTQYLSYLWGPKEWPIPFRLPFKVDMDDDFQYNGTFVVIAIVAMGGLWMIAEQELSMCTLLIQLAREYEFFLKDIRKLNELYEDPDLSLGESNTERSNNEINPYLRNQTAKFLVRRFSTKQQQLILFTEQFEYCYSQTLLLQFVATTVLVVVSLIQCLIESGTFTMKITYQLGYSAILLSDMFLVCWFSTKITTSCFQVGEAIYSTLWYSMSLDLQKDILMILMRSQRPPKITSGKIIVLNLHAFMLLIRNIYSWLALFQQLELKI